MNLSLNNCEECGEKTTAYDSHRIHFTICGHCAEKLGKAWLKDKERWLKNAEKSEDDRVADLSEQ